MKLGDIYQKSFQRLKTAGFTTPALDSEILLKKATGHTKVDILLSPELPLTNSELSRFNRLLRKRITGLPIAYILGHKEFYGLDFFVDKNVLIPRPETEKLIEESLELLKSSKNSLEVLDVGTGSGCMIIYLATVLEKHCHGLARLNACDISKSALRVARKNAKKFGVSAKIKFYHSDLFSNRLLHKKFDLIIANLPYVPYSRKLNSESTIKYEPKIAIFAGDNGSEIIKRFISDSRDRLKTGGSIFLELDPRNADSIAKFAQNIFPNANISVEEDLAKRERYLKIRQI